MFTPLLETAASVTCHHFVGTEHVVLQDAETQVHREKKATGHEVVKRKLPTAYRQAWPLFEHSVLQQKYITARPERRLEILVEQLPDRTVLP